jgi:transposase
MSVAEQRYRAVSLVLHDGESVVEVTRRFGVSCQTVQSGSSRVSASIQRYANASRCVHDVESGIVFSTRA